VYKFDRVLFAVALVLAICSGAAAQTKPFTPVEGANLKAKIDAAVTQGRANAPDGRFWVGYQFEVRPNVAIDYEIVDSSGTISVSGDGWSIFSDSRYETRELGFFQLYEGQLGRFTRAEVYNLRRDHQFSGYPVYWAGKATNEESLNYLRPMIDTPTAEAGRSTARAAFAIALHDDARVEPLLIEISRKPLSDSLRSSAIYWLGFTPESQAKNSFLADLVRNTRESTEVRQQALSTLGMSRAATTLPVLENFYETMTSRELKRRALGGIARNDNRDGAANFLIRVAQSDTDRELRKSAISGLGRVAGEKSLNALTNTLEASTDIDLQRQAVAAIGRRPKDEAIPILIRTARNHPKVEIRKTAIQILGRTGDERAISLFNELLAK
jgi:hypothetical protein